MHSDMPCISFESDTVTDWKRTTAAERVYLDFSVQGVPTSQISQASELQQREEPVQLLNSNRCVRAGG